jgi:Tfp pilus assembly protein PilP
MPPAIFRLPALPITAALALGIQLGAAAAPPSSKKPVAKAAPQSIATPQSAGSEIDAEDLKVFNATPYRPALVRDPFATPTDAEQTNRGDMVDDIAVKGRVVSGGNVMAVVSDARGNVRMLPVGFKFRDGVLVAIDEKSVTFHQWDPGGTSKVYRTVVKIYKREEAKR